MITWLGAPRSLFSPPFRQSVEHTSKYWENKFDECKMKREEGPTVFFVEMDEAASVVRTFKAPKTSRDFRKQLL